MALARNSGCAQLTTTLVFASTELTIPTRPSGLTTAESGFTPCFLPAETAKVRALVGSGSFSTSAGTEPLHRRGARPGRLRDPAVPPRNPGGEGGGRAGGAGAAAPPARA